MRPFLRRIGVTFGALDIFAPALLKPAPRQLLHAIGTDRRPLEDAMLPVIAGRRKLPSGYRHAGSQAIRIDLAEKIIRAAHETRAKAQGTGKQQDRRRKFVLDLALPVSVGLEEDNAIRLLGQAGFRVQRARPLKDGAFGPPRPDRWEWRPSRRKQERSQPVPPREGSAFAALADLVR
jgi:ATP-dependent RNA helicase SUPV3L1/SUV3